MVEEEIFGEESISTILYIIKNVAVDNRGVFCVKGLKAPQFIPLIKLVVLAQSLHYPNLGEHYCQCNLQRR